VAFGHDPARISEALDAREHGVVSHVNHGAAALGLRPGVHLRDAIEQFFAAPAANQC